MEYSVWSVAGTGTLRTGSERGVTSTLLRNSDEIGVEGEGCWEAGERLQGQESPVLALESHRALLVSMVTRPLRCQLKQV